MQSELVHNGIFKKNNCQIEEKLKSTHIPTPDLALMFTLKNGDLWLK